MLFLSYAEEDGETAREIAESLGGQGLKVLRWQDPQNRGGLFIQRIEDAIHHADAFLALLSPSFMASTWCRLERELALHREQDLRVSGSTGAFIHVLKIVDGQYHDAGLLRSYDWVDLTHPEEKKTALTALAQRLEPGSQTETAASAAAIPSRGSSLFRNRHDELERVLRGLANAAGPHFWLVIAPPQLGKTWFLDRLSAELLSTESSAWATRLIDLREQPAEVRSDVGALLARLFGLPSPIIIEPRALLSIAQEISRSGKAYLCLLDSAELLNDETIRTLRTCLRQIYRLVQRAGNVDVRLGFIVASRQESEWRGVFPDPRLSALPLTEFKLNVVQETLHDLALHMVRSFNPAEFQQNAALVHYLSEGLPALLVRCLQWIRAEEWLEMERLESQELFEELAHPYIREGLLSQESLAPWNGAQTGEPRHALDEAFRVLAPYRLFTKSHLRHHLESEPAFEAILTNLDWSMEDLWRAISGTALLLRPLNEPWQEIHAAIRRLLHRYYYRSDERRAEAHSEARKFVEVWAERQSGKEQVVGMVECLWHEATVLRLREPAEMEHRLSESARALSCALKESAAYTLDELRDYASERMSNDEELQEALSNVDGLLGRLVDIVETPQRES